MSPALNWKSFVELWLEGGRRTFRTTKVFMLISQILKLKWYNLHQHHTTELQFYCLLCCFFLTWSFLSVFGISTRRKLCKFYMTLYWFLCFEVLRTLSLSRAVINFNYTLERICSLHIVFVFVLGEKFLCSLLIIWCRWFWTAKNVFQLTFNKRSSFPK